MKTWEFLFIVDSHPASICILFKLYEKCSELFSYLLLNYIFF